MKKRVLLSVLMVVGLAGLSYAQPAMEEKAASMEQGMMDDKMAPAGDDVMAPAAGEMAAVNAGNKICPVLGNPVAADPAVTVEYKGKLYNLCCPMCKATFLKDPEMYVKKVEAELAAPAK